jgi:hypothetical protein
MSVWSFWHAEGRTADALHRCVSVRKAPVDESAEAVIRHVLDESNINVISVRLLYSSSYHTFSCTSKTSTKPSYVLCAFPKIRRDLAHVSCSALWILDRKRHSHERMWKGWTFFSRKKENLSRRYDVARPVINIDMHLTTGISVFKRAGSYNMASESSTEHAMAVCS